MSDSRTAPRRFTAEEAEMDKAIWSVFNAQNGKDYASVVHTMMGWIDRFPHFVDFSRRFANGTTPLMAVARMGDEASVVHLVTRYGAHLDARMRNGPFVGLVAEDIARREGHVKVAEWLRNRRKGVAVSQNVRVVERVLDASARAPSDDTATESCKRSRDFRSRPSKLDMPPKNRMWTALSSWSTDATKKYIQDRQSRLGDATFVPGRRAIAFASDTRQQRASHVFASVNAALVRVLPFLVERNFKNSDDEEDKEGDPPSIRSLRTEIEALIDTFSFRRPVDMLRAAQWDVVVVVFIEALGVATLSKSHAGQKEFRAVLEKSGFEASEDPMAFLGDALGYSAQKVV